MLKVAPKPLVTAMYPMIGIFKNKGLLVNSTLITETGVKLIDQNFLSNGQGSDLTVGFDSTFVPQAQLTEPKFITDSYSSPVMFDGGRICYALSKRMVLLDGEEQFRVLPLGNPATVSYVPYQNVGPEVCLFKETSTEWVFNVGAPFTLDKDTFTPNFLTLGEGISHEGNFATSEYPTTGNTSTVMLPLAADLEAKSFKVLAPAAQLTGISGQIRWRWLETSSYPTNDLVSSSYVYVGSSSSQSYAFDVRCLSKDADGTALVWTSKREVYTTTKLNSNINGSYLVNTSSEVAPCLVNGASSVYGEPLGCDVMVEGMFDLTSFSSSSPTQYIPLRTMNISDCLLEEGNVKKVYSVATLTDDDGVTVKSIKAKCNVFTGSNVEPYDMIVKSGSNTYNPYLDSTYPNFTTVEESTVSIVTRADDLSGNVSRYETEYSYLREINGVLHLHYIRFPNGYHMLMPGNKFKPGTLQYLFRVDNNTTLTLVDKSSQVGLFGSEGEGMLGFVTDSSRDNMHMITTEGVRSLFLNDDHLFEMFGQVVDIPGATMLHVDDDSTTLTVMSDENEVYQLKTQRADFVDVDLDEADMWYNGEERTIYATVSVRDYEGTYLPRSITLMLDGNAEFESNSSRKITVESSDAGAISVAIKLTGYGSVYLTPASVE